MLELQYAIRPTPLLKYFDQLCITLAILTIVPFIVLLLFGDYRISFRFSVVIMGVFFLGFSLMRVQASKRI